MKIYHNPRCGKSRQTLNLLQERGIEPEVVLYLKTPPSKEELKNLIEQLNITPSQLLRKGEKIYKEQFEGKEIAEEEWIDIMIAHPKLIERPIVVKNGKAVLGRPPENVLDLL